MYTFVNIFLMWCKLNLTEHSMIKVTRRGGARENRNQKKRKGQQDKVVLNE